MNRRQTKFVNEYLKDFNATRAAKAAGYSKKTAYSIGQENLKKPEIRAAIDERMMGEDEVRASLTDIARGNMADLMDITTSGFTLQLMVEDELTGEKIVNPKTKLIKKIKQKTTTFLAKRESDEDREVIETEIELYSAHDALRDIGKLHGMFKDRIELSGQVENLHVFIPDNGRNPTDPTPTPEN